MRTPRELPEPLKERVFSVQEARRLGIPAARLRAKDLDRPFPGLRRPSGTADATLWDLAHTYALRLTPDQYFSHTTAARLLGMRLPAQATRSFDPAEVKLHVTSVLPKHAPRVSGVIGHTARDRPPLLRDGLIAVSDPIATWFDLAASLSTDELIVLGDGLLSRRSPVATQESLRARIDGSSMRRGRAKLEQALVHLRPGTDSAPETRLRLLLLRNGLPEPEVNGLIQTSARRYHGDLVFRDERVVIEYDGGHHRTDERQFSIDIVRLDHIAEAGWRVIRVDRHALADRFELVRRVRTALDSR